MIEPAATEDEQPTQRPSEQQLVVARRFEEAQNAGLSLVEAGLFAESDADIGHLRKLVAGGCPPAEIAAILI